MSRRAAVPGLVGAVVASACLRRFTIAIVQGHSMSPTLRDGDHILVRRRRRYRVGDIVLFRLAEPFAPGTPRWRVKRVTAVAGDPTPPAWAGWELPATVPAGQLAVAGDGQRSEDSRHLGYVPISYIAGRVCRRPGRSDPISRSGAGRSRSR